MKKGFRITPIKPFKESKTVVKYEFSSRKTSDYMLIKAKKGEVLGEHYHEGKVVAKNPEQIIFIEGKAKLFGRHVKTRKMDRKVIKAPCIINIYPYWYHEMIALTDIILVDLGSLKDHKADRKE